MRKEEVNVFSLDFSLKRFPNAHLVFNVSMVYTF